jgi:hypothetical protein
MLWLGVASGHLRLVRGHIALVRMPLLRVVKFRHLWLAHCHVGSLRMRLLLLLRCEVLALLSLFSLTHTLIGQRFVDGFPCPRGKV